ncbi:MAG: SusD/RagB family nutrient-binding outer membrane lipoprotein [Chitinophagales bacterium]
MKKYLIFFAALAMVSCKKYLNVNINPNTATVTKANYVFTNALKVTADIEVGGLGALGHTWTGQWAHSTSFTGGGQEKTYVFTNNDFNFFDGIYDNLTDYQYTIDHAAADGFPHIVSPAKIMQCLMYQKLVDLYGNVPYSQALKGTAFTYPAYDDAQTIYSSLITTLTAAIADIKATTWPLNEASDIFFSGNKTNWIKLANTLKLRILMRQSYMASRASYITTELNNIVTEGSGFITDNVYCNPGYTKTSGKLNPFYANWGFDQNDAQSGNRAYRMMNNVMITYLKNSTDQYRLSRIADTVPGSGPALSTNYAGVPMGSATGYLSSSVSPIGREQIVKGDAGRSSIIMTVAESYFLQSEAALVFGIGSWGTVQNLYNSGVQWAFRLATATQAGTATGTNASADAAATLYLTPGSGAPFADWNLATTTVLKRTFIQVQKWVALCNIDGSELWAEYRRINTTDASGVVSATPGANGAFGCSPYTPHSVVVAPTSPEPVRLFYPLRESSVNGSNVPAGINVFTSKIFWDVN